MIQNDWYKHWRFVIDNDMDHDKFILFKREREREIPKYILRNDEVQSNILYFLTIKLKCIYTAAIKLLSHIQPNWCSTQCLFFNFFNPLHYLSGYVSFAKILTYHKVSFQMFDPTLGLFLTPWASGLTSFWTDSSPELSNMSKWIVQHSSVMLSRRNWEEQIIMYSSSQ